MTTTLAERRSEQVTVTEPPTVNVAAMFERLAQNPEIPVDKLQALMDMQRSVIREQAAQQFNSAMAAAQSEIRRIKADAYNTQTKSKYATYAALDRVLRPIYTSNGFGLSFDTGDAGVAEMVTLVFGDAHENVTKIKDPIDLVFLDADKAGYVDYLKKLLPLVKPGGLIVAHNVRGQSGSMKPFLDAINTDKNLETLYLHMYGTGVSVSMKKR